MQLPATSHPPLCEWCHLLRLVDEESGTRPVAAFNRASYLVRDMQTPLLAVLLAMELAGLDERARQGPHPDPRANLTHANCRLALYNFFDAALPFCSAS
jgi:hypothetical protein